MNMIEKISGAKTYIQGKTSIKPRLGMILGSGLGGILELVTEKEIIPYSEIPHFLPASVPGHQGNLCLGKIDDVPVAILAGRIHFYEGHSMSEVVFPTRVLGALGIQTLLLTNASGGINFNFQPGDIMVITDHINLMGSNPLMGPVAQDLGPRFPDMSNCYSKKLVKILLDSSEALNVNVRQGVYAGLTGPTYETAAEVRMLRILGADAVGMSTVPECIAANHLGIEVCGLSIISNLAAGMTGAPLSHSEVTSTAARVSASLNRVIENVVPALVRPEASA